jgi:hypothetical protein
MEEGSSRASPSAHPASAAATEAGAPSAACSHCPTEDGCGSFEVCRIMRMSDEEIIATTPNADAVAAEMRAVLAEALERHAPRSTK